jgi:hypothetical protein
LSRRASPWDEWAFVPDTLKELWAAIGAAAFELGTETRVAWRGLADSDFKVISTLARELQGAGIPLNEENIRKRELEILQSARDWGIGLSEHGSVTDFHLLAMLQHHGASTRLIDITYNPLTALWFACADMKATAQPGVLVVLTISDKDVRISSDTPQLTWDTVDLPREASVIAAMRHSKETGRNIIVEPRPKDDRMKVQEGAFITSYWPEGDADGPVVGLHYPENARILPSVLESVVNGSAQVQGDAGELLQFAGIVIKPELKAELLPFLARTFNRSFRTMYPDLSGFVEAHRNGHLTGDHRGIPDSRFSSLPEYWLR